MLDKSKEGLPYVCTSCKKRYSNWKEVYWKSLEETEKAKREKYCEGCRRHYVHPSMLRIIGPFILIMPSLKDGVTKNGVIMPVTMWRLWRIGEVSALGEKEIFKCDRREPGKNGSKTRAYGRPDVKIGDTVLVLKNAIRHVRMGCENYYFVHYNDVECVVEKPEHFMPA